MRAVELGRWMAMVVAALAAARGGTAAWAQPREAPIQTQWVFEADAARAGSAFRAAIEFRVGNHFHVQSNKPADEFSIPTQLTVTAPAGVQVREIAYPKSVPFEVEGFDEPLMVFDADFAIGISLEIGADVAPGVYPLIAILEYQACDNSICLAPATLELKSQVRVVATDAAITKNSGTVLDRIVFTGAPPDQTATGQPRITAAPATRDCDVIAELENFTIIGTAGGYLNVNNFLQFVDGAEKGTLKKNLFEGMGPVLIVLAVILGGVLLNLTPCVLPLIPINLAIIGAGAQAGSRSRGFALGGAYGLAMAVVYGALGLIVVLSSSAFGTINSTIWFNIAIAILFVFLALAMFDVIAIDFTKYQSNIDATKVASRGSLALAFFMGCVTALLAGACVAPVVIQVIVYAGDQYARWTQGQGGSPIALALPFFLGLGMALPWPFAGAGLSLLPKPGKWMNWVKKGMGVFILGFAVWYAVGAWKIWRVESLAKGAQVVKLEGGWTADICAGLAQARTEDKLVFIDMWATWCKNCLAMDKTTFKDPAVVARLEDYVKIKFQAEDLTASPEKEVLAKFEGVGLPHYAILRPKSSTSP
jgi:thiol:disulfide interchange protein DsbD